MDKKERAEAAFERVWQNFRLDKARLRSLSLKDKSELKMLMKTVFMSSMAVNTETTEIKLELEGIANSDEVESAVRRVLKEELGGLTGLLEEIKNKPAGTTTIVHEGSTRSVVSEVDEVVDLHGAIFAADIKTNIDDVSVEGDEVTDVKANREALRRLQSGSGDSERSKE